jgi:hypothetical protein
MVYTSAITVVNQEVQSPGVSTVCQEYSSHVLEEGAQCYMIPSYEQPVLLELKGIYLSVSTTFKLSLEKSIDTNTLDYGVGQGLL